MIRCYLEDRLDRRELARAHYEGLVKIRMNFLKGVEEKTCKQKVWILEKAYELKIQECNVLESFLDKVRELQANPNLQLFRDLCAQSNRDFSALKSTIRLEPGSGPLLKI